MIRRWGWLVVVLALWATQAEAKVRAEAVSYGDGAIKMKGYWAYDAARKGQRAGVLVVHEWWGHNEYARRRARMLAKLGYVALAVDMYGDGKQAAHPKDAKRFAMAVMKEQGVAKERFLAALHKLRSHPAVDPKRIAAIGYCFGGGIVLNMARGGVELRGVASFHGSLNPRQDGKPGSVRAEILVLNGGADPFVTKEQITAFKKEMAQRKAKMRFISYAGAQHAFTNPGATAFGKKFKLPLAYDAKADRASWKEMSRFFRRVLKKRK